MSAEPTLPALTLITATYNAAAHLPRLIESVRSQRGGGFEWIVIDGASTDGTQALLGNSPEVVTCWVSEPDSGIYDAWNKGLARARGEWVAFLGADDFLWSPEVLATLRDVLARQPARCVAVYGRVNVVTAQGDVLYSLGAPWAKRRRAFRSVMNVPHPGLMHRRAAMRACGDFDPGYRIAADYALLRCMLRSAEALYLPHLTVAGMSVGGVSTRPESSRLMLREMRRAARSQGQWLPGAAWWQAWARYALRTLLWRVLGERITRRLLDLGRRACGKPRHWTRT